MRLEQVLWSSFYSRESCYSRNKLFEKNQKKTKQFWFVNETWTSPVKIFILFPSESDFSVKYEIVRLGDTEIVIVLLLRLSFVVIIMWMMLVLCSSPTLNVGGWWREETQAGRSRQHADKVTTGVILVQGGLNLIQKENFRRWCHRRLVLVVPTKEFLYV